MKKFTELVRPFLALIFGALLFLYYMNTLKASGAELAIGIVGFIFAIYYLSIGVMGVVWPSMPAGAKRVFNIISITLYPTFMFVYFIFYIVRAYEFMYPSQWVIIILGMISAISLSAFYVVSRFARQEVFVRLASLFGLVFALCLVCSVLFQSNGQNYSVLLGQIEVVPILIYCIYCSLMFNSLNKEK